MQSVPYILNTIHGRVNSSSLSWQVRLFFVVCILVIFRKLIIVNYVDE